MKDNMTDYCNNSFDISPEDFALLQKYILERTIIEAAFNLTCNHFYFYTMIENLAIGEVLHRVLRAWLRNSFLFVAVTIDAIG